MSPSKIVRLAALPAVAATVLVAGPALAGKDNPKPCNVSYAANSAHPGGSLTTGFYVACSADSTTDLTSIDLSTDISDVSNSGTMAHCATTAAGTSANDPCALAGVKRGHAYSVTFVLTAHGNFLSCVDDGACSSSADMLSPYCATDTRTAQRLATGATDPVVTCTYRRLIPVVN